MYFIKSEDNPLIVLYTGRLATTKSKSENVCYLSVSLGHIQLRDIKTFHCLKCESVEKYRSCYSSNEKIHRKKYFKFHNINTLWGHRELLW